MPNDKYSVQFGVNQDGISEAGSIGKSSNTKLYMGVGVYF